MKTRQVNFWPWHQGCEFFHKLHGRHFDGGGAIVPWFFEFVDHVSGIVNAEPTFCNGRTSNVSYIVEPPDIFTWESSFKLKSGEDQLIIFGSTDSSTLQRERRSGLTCDEVRGRTSSRLKLRSLSFRFWILSTARA